MFYACRVGSLSNIYELCYHGANSNHISKNGETPLFKAKTQEVVTLLLKNGAKPEHFKQSKQDANGMENIGDVEKNDAPKNQVSVIQHLMETNPKCARAILDNCLSRKTTNETDNELTLDFGVFKAKKDKSEVDIIKKALEKNRQEIVLHPIMAIFLHVKYQSLRYHFYSQLFFQLLCVLYFTYLGIDYVNLQRCKVVHDFTKPNQNCFTTKRNLFVGCELNKTHSEIGETSIPLPIRCIKSNLRSADQYGLVDDTDIESICMASGQNIFECWTKKCIFAVILIVLVVIREIHEFYVTDKSKNFLKQPENYVQLVIFLTSTSFIIVSHLNVYFAGHLAAWMVFFSWIDLTLLFGQTEKLGEYIYMSMEVLQTMAFCILIYIPSFLAFSFGFYILLNVTESFSSYFQSMIKVLAMSVGELDYTTNFDYNQVKKYGGINISSQVMFVAFIITMALIMMNILLAVTIGKTEDIEPKSKVRQAKRRTNEISIATELKYMDFYKMIFKKLHFGKPILRDGAKNHKVNILQLYAKVTNHMVSNLSDDNQSRW